MITIKAIIPVAGRGTRLRPLTHSKPKALLFVAGKPILGHILDQVHDSGIKDVVLIIGYLGDSIKEYVNEEYQHMNFEFVEQKKQLGPGHAISLTEPYIDPEEKLLIIFGDTIFLGDLKKGIKTDKDAVLAVKKVDDPRRFGVVEKEGDRVTAVVEKPDYVKPMEAMIGIYFVNRAKLLFQALHKMVQDNRMTKGEFYLTDALQIMVENGNYMTTFEMEGWYDCGKPETMLQTNKYLLNLNKPKNKKYESCIIKEPVFIDESAMIKNSMIGPNVSIERGVEIEGSSIENSIINMHSFIRASKLKDSLVGEDTVVKNVSGKINIGCHSDITID